MNTQIDLKLNKVIAKLQEIETRMNMVYQERDQLLIEKKRLEKLCVELQYICTEIYKQNFILLKKRNVKKFNVK